MSKTLCIAILALVVRLHGQTLAEFTCERPQPWDEGVLKNVSVAAALLDGTVLAPGQVFSFNQAMTPGLERFVPGTSYASGRVVTSDGGGICQVSTGLYNAVLLAGLDIKERGNHSLYDPAAAYVPAGRDAMVARSSQSDFRFINSTAAPMTLSVKAQGGRLDIHIQGHQRHPKKRWIQTEVVQTLPSRQREVEDLSLGAGERRLKRKGFDGLVVKRQLCWLGAQGLTRCAGLGRDAYMQVDEVWAVGARP